MSIIDSALRSLHTLLQLPTNKSINIAGKRLLLLAPLSLASASFATITPLPQQNSFTIPSNMPTATPTSHPPHHPKHIVAFGDSLTSTTNGRWTDGPVWVERVAASVGAKLDNSAWGGAVSGPVPGPDGTMIKGWVPSVLDQVDRWERSLSEHKKKLLREEDTVYVIWAGGNDYFQLAKHVPYPVTVQVVRNLMGAVLTTPSRVVGNLQTALGRLVEGPTRARHFLVFNLPPLDHVPLVTDNMPSALRPVIKGWVKYHNYRVSQISDWIRNTYGPGSASPVEGLTVTLVDVYSVMEDVVANPNNYGFEHRDSRVEEPGYGRKGSERRLFYDLVHPSAWAHEKLAEVVVG
ncbi:hypothetical protein HK097_002985, partial [Rhizophlyctis rosea]